MDPTFSLSFAAKLCCRWAPARGRFPARRRAGPRGAAARDGSVGFGAVRCGGAGRVCWRLGARRLLGSTVHCTVLLSITRNPRTRFEKREYLFSDSEKAGLEFLLFVALACAWCVRQPGARARAASARPAPSCQPPSCRAAELPIGRARPRAPGVRGWGSSYGQRVSVDGQHRDSTVLIQSSAQIGIQEEREQNRVQ